MNIHDALVTPSFGTDVSDLIRRVIRDRNRVGHARHRAAGRLCLTPRPALVVCTAIVASLCGTVSGAEEDKTPTPLTLTLSAYVAVVQNNVTVRARVEPDTRSRELVIEWVADDLSGGSHAVSLEGARAAPSHRYTLKHLAPGQYVVTAIVRRNDGTETRSASNLRVVGIGETVDVGTNATRGSAGGLLRPATQP